MMTQQLRQLLDRIDAAMQRGDRWTANMLASEVENAALDVSNDVQNWAAQDSDAVGRGYALQAIRRGQCPDSAVLPFVTPEDIRDSAGRFLPKRVRESILECWRNGSDENVEFFIAFAHVNATRELV